MGVLLMGVEAWRYFLQEKQTCISQEFLLAMPSLLMRGVDAAVCRYHNPHLS